MWHPPFLKVPKEEQEVPEANFSKLDSTSKDALDVMDELEGFLGIKDDCNDNKLSAGSSNCSQLTWDFMDLDEFPSKQVGENYYEEEKEHPHGYYGTMLNCVGAWDDNDEQKGVSLNLNLNYQEVMDAWSDRGSFWADEYSLSVASNGYYMGEVPVMEEEKTRREASVLRYKEKRQMRLFSKKIRYQVRKLNADKRPRLKGRFVKRVS